MSVRVKVCLREIFKDYRKEAFVYVDPNFKYVCDFEKHIKKLFNIQFGIYLTIDDNLLPSNEIVNVICSGDIIIVNKFVKELNNGFELSLIQRDKDDNDLHQAIEFDNQSNDEINPPKRGKRIRKRKRKLSTTGKDVAIQESTSSETIETPNLIVLPKKLSTEVTAVNAGRLSSKTSHSHIRFSNDDIETDPTTLGQLSETTKNVDATQARVLRPVTVLTNATNAGRSAPTDNQCLKQRKSRKVSAEARKVDLNSLKEFANDSNFAQVAASIDFEEIIRGIENNKEFVPLKDEPKIYDVLAFKMLKIGKNYEPQLSEWIVAMVKDAEDLDISLSILAGKDETSSPDGKLSMEICEEESEPSDAITLRRSDMLNVKVFRNEQ